MLMRGRVCSAQPEQLSPMSHEVLWSIGCGAGAASALLVLGWRAALSWRTAVAVALAWLGMIAGAKLHYRLEIYPLADALLVTPAELLRPGGGRLPLGLLTGAVLAGLWCVAVRAPWRATGDALAVAACVMIALGRIGCLSAGCCGGSLCERWTFSCLTYPPVTSAYEAQVAAGQITPGAATSLPAHPLPLYSMGVALLTLAALLWMLRRGTPAGSLLALFIIVHPASTLLLESIRAQPRPPQLMLGIPLAELIVAITVLAILHTLRRRAHPATARREEPSPTAV